MQRVEVKEAQERLPDLIEAAVQGATVLITTEGRQTVRLVPQSTNHGGRHFGSARGRIWIADDFDEPLDDFREYME